MRGTLLIGLSAVLLAGCLFRGKKENAPEPAAPTQPVTVRVKNFYALPVEVFAIGNGTTHHLGTVLPGLTAEYVIPRSVLASSAVELEARSSSSRYVGSSGPLLLKPGAFVEFVVSSTLFNSTATIYD